MTVNIVFCTSKQFQIYYTVCISFRFVGEMGREEATNLLDKHANGTYLLRIRPQGPTHPNETAYALSLK
jgi:hypothetical protein